MLIVNKEKCSGDGVCVTICPVEAIEMVDDKAFINVDTCMECYSCMNTCSEEAITEEQ